MDEVQMFEWMDVCMSFFLILEMYTYMERLLLLCVLFSFGMRIGYPLFGCRLCQSLNEDKWMCCGNTHCKMCTLSCLLFSDGHIEELLILIIILVNTNHLHL